MDSTLPKVLAFQFHHRSNYTHNNKFQKLPTFFLLILISLFSLYFLTFNSTNFIWVFPFFAILVLCLALTLPHLQNPRTLLPQYQRSNLSINQKSAHPVIWSIGSDPNLGKGHKSTQNLASHVIWSIGLKPKLEKGKKSGHMVKGFINGDVYEGESHEKKCSGSGIYYYYMCGKYEGDWVDGKYEGYGVESWLRGSKFRGQYKNGLRHGFGVYKFYGGDVFEGEWFNGQCHGCGVHISADGSKFVGEFKWGVKQGFGHYHYRNGDVYAGEYFADKMHGFGVYEFRNGQRYEGSWHEGRRHGLGMHTFRNGEAQFGYWQYGILNTANNQKQVSGSLIPSDRSRFSDVVQNARQASQRAYNVESADDLVSKVVAAANRAANAARMAAVKAVQKSMLEDINSRLVHRK